MKFTVQVGDDNAGVKEVMFPEMSVRPIEREGSFAVSCISKIGIGYANSQIQFAPDYTTYKSKYASGKTLLIFEYKAFKIVFFENGIEVFSSESNKSCHFVRAKTNYSAAHRLSECCVAVGGKELDLTVFSLHSLLDEKLHNIASHSSNAPEDCALDCEDSSLRIFVAKNVRQDGLSISSPIWITAICSNPCRPHIVYTGSAHHQLKVYDVGDLTAPTSSSTVNQNDSINKMKKQKGCDATLRRAQPISVHNYGRATEHHPITALLALPPLSGLHSLHSQQSIAAQETEQDYNQQSQQQQLVVIGNSVGALSLVDLNSALTKSRKQTRLTRLGGDGLDGHPITVLRGFAGVSGTVSALAWCHGIGRSLAEKKPLADFLLISVSLDRYLRVHSVRSGTLLKKLFVTSRMTCLRLLEADEEEQQEQREEMQSKNTREMVIERVEGEKADNEEENIWSQLEEVGGCFAESENTKNFEQNDEQRKQRKKKQKILNKMSSRADDDDNMDDKDGGDEEQKMEKRKKRKNISSEIESQKKVLLNN